jgi:hypothetical protein
MRGFLLSGVAGMRREGMIECFVIDVPRVLGKMPPSELANSELSRYGMLDPAPRISNTGLVEIRMRFSATLPGTRRRKPSLWIPRRTPTIEARLDGSDTN